MEKKIEDMSRKTIVEKAFMEFEKRKNRGNDLIGMMQRAVKNQHSDIFYADEYLKKQLIAEISRNM